LTDRRQWSLAETKQSPVKDEEFDTFLERVYLHNLAQNRQLCRIRSELDGNERFVVDYSSRLLTFFVGEAPTAEAFILLLGTYSIDKQRFRWSWSDEGLQWTFGMHPERQRLYMI
jgi:hypothetical protein